MKNLFKFRTYKRGWFSFYLFECNGRRLDLGICLDCSEGNGQPILAIKFLIGSIEIEFPYYD